MAVSLVGQAKKILIPATSRFQQVGIHVADQALISIANFTTGILLARILGVHAFGHFVWLQAIYYYANTLQSTLVIAPMSSLAPAKDGDFQAEFLAGALLTQIVLAAGLFVGVTSLAVFSKTLGLYFDFSYLAFPLAFWIFSFQLQEWFRRYFFVVGQPTYAVISDGVAYLFQVVIIITLHYYSELTLAGAMWGLCFSSLLGLVTSLGLSTPSLRRGARAAKGFISESGQLAKNLFLAGQFQWASSQGVLMVGGTLIGAQAIGATRAIINLFGPVNVLFQLLETTVPIKAARRYKIGGLNGMLRSLWTSTGLAFLLLAAPLLVVSLWSRPILDFTVGAQYVQFSGLVFWQVIYVLLGLLVRQASYFHRTLNTTSYLLVGSFCGCLLSVALGYALSRPLQQDGLMVALVSGQSISLAVVAYGIVTVLRKTRKSRDSFE